MIGFIISVVSASYNIYYPTPETDYDILIMINLFLPSIFTTLSCDVAEVWQIGFQDGATPSSEGIVELHDTIFFYLIVVATLVLWMIGATMVNFSSTKAGIVHKYTNHGTLIELIWTITPAFVLVAIAFPSFKLLYLMDYPRLYLDLAISAMGTIPISKIKTQSTALVPYGVTGASNNIRLNKHSRDITVLSYNTFSQLVGHLLGDGSLMYSRTSVTPYFVFTQTVKRFEYIWHVYQTLSSYCGRIPLFNPGLRKGVPYPFMQVLTRSYPALSVLHELFYLANPNGKGYIKVISYELLYYLNPVSLAYWAMDDGACAPKGFYLHTEGFTFMESYKLAAMLHYQFGLHSTIQLHEGKPIIKIATKSMTLFRSIVTPHFHQSMLYKLRS